MSKIDLGNLDSMQYDVLKELGNIGAGNATTATNAENANTINNCSF